VPEPDYKPIVREAAPAKRAAKKTARKRAAKKTAAPQPTPTESPAAPADNEESA
jgi:hypothetical protein